MKLRDQLLSAPFEHSGGHVNVARGLEKDKWLNHVCRASVDRM